MIYFTGLILILIFLWGASFLLPIPKGAYGSARFVSKRTNGLKKKHTGLVIDGVNRLKQSDRGHCMVVGKTGSGKSQSYSLPNILRMADSENSMIILDIKGELFEVTQGYVSKTHNIEVIDFGNPFQTLQFNILSGLNSSSLIKGFAAQLYECSGVSDEGTPIWKQWSENLYIVALQCTLNLPEARHRNLANFLRIMYSIGSGRVESLVRKYVKDQDTKDIWNQYQNCNEKLQSNILISALAALSPLNTEEIKHITATTIFSFEQLRKRPTALYIKIPSGSSSDSYYALISLYFNSLFSWLLENPAMDKDNAIYMYLDEFSSLTLKDFDQVISLIRGNGKTSVSILLQDLKQLRNRYGQDKMEVILANISHFIFYTGLTGKSSLEYVKNLIGVSTHKYIDEATGTQQTIYRPLLNEDEIRTMPFSLYIGNSYPSKIYPKPLYEQKKLMAKTGILSSPNKLKSSSIVSLGYNPLPVQYYSFEAPKETISNESDFSIKLKELLPYDLPNNTQP